MNTRKSLERLLIFLFTTSHYGLFAQVERAGPPTLTPYQAEVNNFKTNANIIIPDANLNISSGELLRNIDYSDYGTLVPTTKNYSESLNAENGDYIKTGKSTSSTLDIHKIQLGAKTLENIKCIEVRDDYSLQKQKSSLNFVYHNTYYYIYDLNTNEHLASINYVNVKSGFLSSEFKTIQVMPGCKMCNGINTLSAEEIKRNFKEDELVIVPNPATTSFSFEFTLANDETVSLSIYNINGQLLQPIISNSYYKAGNYKKEITDVNLAAGMYFVKLQTENSLITSKLIIQ